MYSLCRVRNKVKYVPRDELLLRSLGCYFGIYLKTPNNPPVTAETYRHSSTYIIIYVFLVIVLTGEWNF